MAKESETTNQQKASAFWKAYFAKFRRRIGDHEPSETGPAPLAGATPTEPPALPFPDRRRSGPRHAALKR